MDELGVGSVVEVNIAGEPHYGVIKWIGSGMYGNQLSTPKVAGVEMVSRSSLNVIYMGKIFFIIVLVSGRRESTLLRRLPSWPQIF